MSSAARNFITSYKLGVAVAIGGHPYSLFAVTGFVRVWSMFGYISTAISANATALDMVFAPTVGSNAALAASTTVTSLPAGRMLGVTGDSADVLVSTTDGYTLSPKFPNVGIFGPGTILQGISGASASTGNIDWYIEWTAVSPSGKIVAV